MESRRHHHYHKTADAVGPRLGPGDHACLVDDDAEDSLGTLASFVAGGFERAERVVVALGEAERGSLERALAEDGVDVPSAVDEGALRFVDPERVVPAPPFDLSTTADRLERRIREARGDGEAGVRIAMDLRWTEEIGLPAEALIEFERTVSHCVLPGRRATALCLHSGSEMRTATIDDIVASHPLVVVGGLASPNPLFGLEDATWAGGGPGAWQRLRWILPLLERAADAERAVAARVEADQQRQDALAALVRRLRSPLAALSVAGRRLEDGADLTGEEATELGTDIRRRVEGLTELLDRSLESERSRSGDGAGTGDAPPTQVEFDASRSDVSGSTGKIVRERKPAAGSGDTTGSGSRRSTGSARILVVDDDLDSARVLLDLLEAWGHRADLAADGAEALELVGRVAPDLVFLDLGLPKLNGLEVARKIREGADERGRPVLVAMTGWGGPEDRKRTREVGFDHHVAKPISVERVRKLLERPS